MYDDDDYYRDLPYADDTGDAESPPITIDDMDLTIRSYNCLTRGGGITTVAELIERSEDDLLDIRNFGQRGVEEVKGKLADHGLRLRATPQPYTDEVVHEMVNIYRCQGITVTVQPDGFVHLSHAHFAPNEFIALRKIIAQMPEEKKNGEDK